MYVYTWLLQSEYGENRANHILSLSYSPQKIYITDIYCMVAMESISVIWPFCHPKAVQIEFYGHGFDVYFCFCFYFWMMFFPMSSLSLCFPIFSSLFSSLLLLIFFLFSLSVSPVATIVGRRCSLFYYQFCVVNRFGVG